MNEEELLYNEIYEKTKDCGRTQFIKLLMEELRKNKELQKQLNFAKLASPKMNFEHFRIVNENKRKIDNLRYKNKQLKKQNEDLFNQNHKLKEENQKLHRRDTYTNIVHNQFQIEKKEKRYYENILDELEKWLEKRIKSYEDRKKLGSGYELTEVMQIELTCDRRYLRKIKELKGSNVNV